MRAISVGFLCGLLCSAAQAAEPSDRIVTDRPDVVDSPQVVGRGRFQIETSLDYERDSRDGATTKTLTTPTLLRLGITDKAELRFETDGRVRQRTEEGGESTTLTGWADATVGLKWQQQEGEESGRPGVAWLVHADLASGSRELRGHGVRPSVRVAFEWELPRDFSLGVMPGVIRDSDPATGERFTAGIFAVALGKELSDRSRVFAEVAATQIASRRHGGTIATFDVGAAYLLRRHVQLDVATRLGITNEAPDFALTAGLAIKF